MTHAVRACHLLACTWVHPFTTQYVPWLAGHAQPGPAAHGDPAALPVSPQAAALLGAAQSLVAGGSGALLLVCPEEGSPPTPSSSAGSAAEFGSPFAQPSISLRDSGQLAQEAAMRQLSLGSTEPSLHLPGADDGQAPGGPEQPMPDQEQQRLEPVGRPLQRVKSRR